MDVLGTLLKDPLLSDPQDITSYLLQWLPLLQHSMAQRPDYVSLLTDQAMDGCHGHQYGWETTCRSGLLIKMLLAKVQTCAAPTNLAQIKNLLSTGAISISSPRILVYEGCQADHRISDPARPGYTAW